jgi:hypothetical protein
MVWNARRRPAKRRCRSVLARLGHWIKRHATKPAPMTHPAANAAANTCAQNFKAWCMALPHVCQRVERAKKQPYRSGFEQRDHQQHAAERLSVFVLISTALVQLTTGYLNTLNWYPWPWDFVSVHRFLAYVLIGSILLHVGFILFGGILFLDQALPSFQSHSGRLLT